MTTILETTILMTLGMRMTERTVSVATDQAKMVAFHAAIKAVLNRQLEKMGQEVDNLSKHETLTI